MTIQTNDGTKFIGRSFRMDEIPPESCIPVADDERASDNALQSQYCTRNVLHSEGQKTTGIDRPLLTEVFVCSALGILIESRPENPFLYMSHPPSKMTQNNICREYAT